MRVEKMSEGGVKVGGEISGGRVREEVDCFGKEAVAVECFEVAARDECFGFGRDRKTERDENSGVIRGKCRGGVGVEDEFVGDACYDPV